METVGVHSLLVKRFLSEEKEAICLEYMGMCNFLKSNEEPQNVGSCWLIGVLAEVLVNGKFVEGVCLSEENRLLVLEFSLDAAVVEGDLSCC